MADEQPQVARPPPVAQTKDRRSPAAGTESCRDVNHDLEATELTRLRANYSRATESYHTASVRNFTAPSGTRRWKYAISKFWRSQISMVVNHEACRDHLALERTFLGYLRTSLVISMIGVTVSQLFRLPPSPNSIFGFYILGKPLACICQACAIYSLMLGAYRVWRQQHAMVRGKAIAGGFEVFLLGLGVLVLCILFFIFLIAIDVNKES